MLLGVILVESSLFAIGNDSASIEPNPPSATFKVVPKDAANKVDVDPTGTIEVDDTRNAADLTLLPTSVHITIVRAANSVGAAGWELKGSRFHGEADYTKSPDVVRVFQLRRDITTKSTPVFLASSLVIAFHRVKVTFDDKEVVVGRKEKVRHRLHILPAGGVMVDHFTLDFDIKKFFDDEGNPISTGFTGEIDSDARLVVFAGDAVNIRQAGFIIAETRGDSIVAVFGKI